MKRPRMGKVPMFLNNHKHTLILLAFWGWLVLIFVLSVIPNIPTQKIKVNNNEWRLDYAAHFVLFGLMAVLYIFKSKLKSFKNKRMLPEVLLLILYSFFVEGIQLIVPGRTFNTLDLLSNTSGFLIVLVGYYIFLKCKPKSHL